MILRLFCAAVGLTLVCYTLFSYEDTEKHVKNWFEEAWITVADGQSRISVRYNSFLGRLLDGLNNLFARVYGKFLVSFDAYLTSLSLCLCVGLPIIGEIALRAKGLDLLYLLLASALFLGLPFIRNRRLFAIAFLTCITVASLITTYLYYETIYDASIVFEFTGQWLLFGTIDFIVVALIRRAFRVAEVSAKLWRTLFIVSLGSICGPIFAAIVIIPYGISQLWDIANNLARFYGSIAYGAWAVIMSFSFVAVVIAALFARGLYAIAPRIIYLPIKLKLLENRKATISLGVFLLGIAFPVYREAIERIQKALFA